MAKDRDPFASFLGANAQDSMNRMIEMNLALSRTAMTYWKDWIQVVSDFADATGTNLSEIARNPEQAKESYGKLSDAYREYVRRMTELPQDAIRRMKDELRAMGEARGTDAESESGPGEPRRRAKAKD